MINRSNKYYRPGLTLLLCASLLACAGTSTAANPENIAWQEATSSDSAHPRHENAFVEAGGKYFLLGGRGLKPIDIYDPATGQWSTGQQPPFEIHHFQAIEQHGLILVLGALSGAYPYESPVAGILVYDPLQDRWMNGPALPSDRLRGAAGVASLDDRLYLVAGIVNGHRSGWVPWLDEFDLRTNRWRQLADAPRSRDHFQAGIINKKLVAAGGRRSGFDAEMVFAATVSEVDVFDLASGQWSTLPPAANFPAPRAGTAAVVLGKELIVVGGESPAQTIAHDQADALDLETKQWRSLPSLNVGRHGTQLIAAHGNLVIAGGSGNRGGSPELVHLETLASERDSGEHDQEVVAGVLGFESPRPIDKNTSQVTLVHREGNQALIVGHAQVLGNGKLVKNVRFPFLLIPGETIVLDVAHNSNGDAQTSTLLVKTMQHGVPPLEIALTPPE